MDMARLGNSLQASASAVPARYGQPMPLGALVLDMCVMPSLLRR